MQDHSSVATPRYQTISFPPLLGCYFSWGCRRPPPTLLHLAIKVGFPKLVKSHLLGHDGHDTSLFLSVALISAGCPDELEERSYFGW